jgi:hypothetical protein
LEDYHQEPSQNEGQHLHAENPIQEEGGEDVSNHVEEQYPLAENPTTLESQKEVSIMMEDQHQHADSIPIPSEVMSNEGTSMNRKERGGYSR